MKIGILADFSEAFLKKIISQTKSIGLNDEIVVFPSHAIKAQIMNSSSLVYQSNLDRILILPSMETYLGFVDIVKNEEQGGVLIQNILNEWKDLWNMLKSNNINHVIQILPFNIFEPPLGSVENTTNVSSFSILKHVKSLQLDLYSNQIKFVDLDDLFMRYGKNNLIDLKYLYLSNNPLNPKYLDIFAQFFDKCNFLDRTPTRKCLVIDLDNTFWPGTLAEDGSGAIKSNLDSGLGAVHKDIWKYIRMLLDRGVFVAICSKNDFALVESFFINTDEIPFTLNDFSSIEINWAPKHLNLIKIAQNLNIGLDSLVFLDDSSYECDSVSTFLPSVIVHKFDDPKELSFLNFTSSGFFATSFLTTEDLSRSKNLSANNLHNSLTSNGNYLETLEMQLSSSSVGNSNINRVAQMEMKTNQFNSCNRRFNVFEIDKYLQLDGNYGFCFRFQDKLQDFGIISSILFSITNDGILIVDSWLLSCRVFERNIEVSILKFLLNHFKNVSKIKINYLSTSKNNYFFQKMLSLNFLLDDQGFLSANKMNLNLENSFIQNL